MEQNIKVIVDLFYLMMDAVIILFVMEGMLEYRYKKASRWICMVLIYGILLFKYGMGFFYYSFWSVYSNQILFTITTYITFFIISIIFFKGKVSIKIFTICLYLMLAFIVELALIMFTMLFFGISKNEIMNNDHIFYLELGSSKVAQLIVIEVIKMIQNRRKEQISIKINFEIGAILIFDIISIIVGFVLVRYQIIWSKSKDIYIKVCLSGIFFISVLSVIIIFKLIQRINREIELKVKLEEVKIEEKYREQLNEAEKNLRSLRHDMNNHMNVMKGLLHLEEYEELKQYFSEIYEGTKDANEMLVLDNKPLAVLLHEKIINAKKSGILLELEVSREKMEFPTSELCALVGNLLDNAIEAVEKVTEEKNIYFSLHTYSKKIEINCENPYEERPLEKNGIFLTHKPDKKEHGLGIKKIQEIVQKHQGSFEIVYEDMFKVHIVLPYAEPEERSTFLEQEREACEQLY